MRPLLLDTCAIIWWMAGVRFTHDLVATVARAGDEGQLYVSPVSAWEIGLLARRAGHVFGPSPQAWFARLLAQPIMTLTPLTPARAIDASQLPGDLHRDPADRLLVATARDLGASLVTGDRKLLAYAEQGHVQALAC